MEEGQRKIVAQKLKEVSLYLARRNTFTNLQL